jgi:hypothetical protein
MVRFACLAAVRRSSVEILFRSMSFLLFMNRTSSGAESGSPARYDLCRAVWSEVWGLVDDSGSWVWDLVPIPFAGRNMMAGSGLSSIVAGFWFDSTCSIKRSKNIEFSSGRV